MRDVSLEGQDCANLGQKFTRRLPELSNGKKAEPVFERSFA